MTSKLNAALLAYRTTLLETAVGDLMWRHAGMPKANNTAIIVKARDDVLDSAVKLTAEQLTAELMASGFLYPEQS
jgi:hypothetical protein